MDPEFQAMQECYERLKRFDHITVYRMLEWLRSRVDDDEKAGRLPMQGDVSITSGNG